MSKLDKYECQWDGCSQTVEVASGAKTPENDHWLELTIKDLETGTVVTYHVDHKHGRMLRDRGFKVIGAQIGTKKSDATAAAAAATPAP